MPRRRVVSRTLTVYTVHCIVADLKERVMIEKDYHLLKKCVTNKQYKNACNEIESDANLEVVRVMSVKIQRAYCEMKELDYFNRAEVRFLD